MTFPRGVALVVGAVGVLSCGVALGQDDGLVAPLDPISKALELSQSTGLPILAVAGTET